MLCSNVKIQGKAEPAEISLTKACFFRHYLRIYQIRKRSPVINLVLEMLIDKLLGSVNNLNTYVNGYLQLSMQTPDSLCK